MKKLLSREELIQAGYPYGKVTDFIPFGNPDDEWMRTEPDVCVYIPKRDLGSDCDNCVLAVTVTPDQSELIAVWTQSSAEGFGDNRIVISRSSNGTDWSVPQYIIGKKSPRDLVHYQSSWGLPMFSRSGRLYIFFIQETDHNDRRGVQSGELGIIYSDDVGHTWSEPGFQMLPHSEKWDNANTKIAKNWWSSKGPVKDAQGRYITDFTTEVSPSIRTPERTYPHLASCAGFIRFENIDDDPEPDKVKFSLLPDVDGIYLEDKVFPDMSVAQEASPVLLPDGRIFATFRNMSGYLQYTVGNDKQWSLPRPVIGWDKKPITHPMSPCPLFRTNDGRYLSFSNMNDGRRLQFNSVEVPMKDPYSMFIIRNPLYLMVGVFDKDAEQPIRFGKPYKFFDSDDVSVGFRKKSCTAPLYMAFTEWHGKMMLWYPDRKYYILGKEIKKDLLDKLTPAQ